jgi:biopolymer transport protein ExbB
MLARLFLGLSLVGAEWVLYLLIALSIFSVAIMIERVLFYRSAGSGLREFRERVRSEAASGDLKIALEAARARAREHQSSAADLESEMAIALLSNGRGPAEVLNEVAQDPVMRTRLAWERNLSILATIGSNAPFVGLFGTVLGIIKAFHDLSQQGSPGAQMVTAGISEALVATAVGLLVAIPAVVAFNIFQRKVKAALAEAESLKSFLIGKLAE